uniref:Eva-1 homolog C n=2 Tax=Podarcis muralis TaxID=64176 RepID=A0A670I5P1_PODMU
MAVAFSFYLFAAVLSAFRANLANFWGKGKLRGGNGKAVRERESADRNEAEREQVMYTNRDEGWEVLRGRHPTAGWLTGWLALAFRRQCQRRLFPFAATPALSLSLSLSLSLTHTHTHTHTLSASHHTHFTFPAGGQSVLAERDFLFRERSCAGTFSLSLSGALPFPSLAEAGGGGVPIPRKDRDKHSFFLSLCLSLFLGWGPEPSCDRLGLQGPPASLRAMSELEAAGQHPSRRQVELRLPLSLLSCLLLVWTKEIAALADFSAEYKTRLVCENEELKLHCKESKFLNIYSASYGRAAHKEDTCATEAGRFPQFDCFSYSALAVLSKMCYGKQRCKIFANNHNFGRPCLPGVKKYLNVSYACVPKFIFAAVDPMVNLNPSWKPKEGINFDPKESRFPKKEGIIVSNSLAMFAYIKDHPERAALLFVSSVCVGLVLTLCALVVHVSCSNDLEKLRRVRKRLIPEDKKADENSEEEEEEDDEEEEQEEEREESSSSDFPDELAGFCRTSYSAYCSMDPAELAERIERREQIIQEIWMSSGLDASPTRSLSPFYTNEQQCICFG